MQTQKLLVASENYEELDQYLIQSNTKRIFLVCDNFMPYLRNYWYFESLNERKNICVIKFSDFSSNPQYESVVQGVKLFKESYCDLIVAVGGGSSMDVAKCIKLFSNMDSNINFLAQEVIPNNIRFLAIPTTAGTGSEATKFAVIYYNDEKQSITDESCIPSAILMDYRLIESLPIYQRKSTMMDALSHAVESYWSVNSTAESKNYSKQAIQIIISNKKEYLDNTDLGNKNMLRASYLAGKAINITQTTAGHAMCYKLTSLYGLAHGHAAAMCVLKLWPYMLENINSCIDYRGKDYLALTFDELAKIFNCTDAISGAEKFGEIFRELELHIPKVSEGDYLILKASVNPVRLKNNPIWLDENAINHLYHQILEGVKDEH